MSDNTRIEDGGCYSGELLNCKRHGQGLFIYKGGRYQGEWKDDKKDGYGALEDNSGLFIGIWKDDQKVEGEWSNGFVKYKGQFSNNMFNGFGTFYKKHSKRNGIFWIPEFEGNWKDGVRNGQGITYAEWNITPGYYKSEEGTWVNGKKHGHFEIFSANNVIAYIGQFTDDKRNGWGKEYHLKKITYEGYWKDDKRHGFGSSYSCQGYLAYQGEWKEGVKDGNGVSFAEGFEKERGLFREGVHTDGYIYDTNEEYLYTYVIELQNRMVVKSYRKYKNGDLFLLTSPTMCKIHTQDSICIGHYEFVKNRHGIEISVSRKKNIWIVFHDKCRYIETWKENELATREKFLGDWSQDELLEWVQSVCSRSSAKRLSRLVKKKKWRLRMQM